MNPLGHRHRWTPIQVSWPTQILAIGTSTTLLRRCRCGEYDTLTLAGKWPADAFQRSHRPYPVFLDRAEWVLVAIPAMAAVDSVIRRQYVWAAGWVFLVALWAVPMFRAWRKRKAEAVQPVEDSPASSAEQGSEHTGGSRG